MIAGYPIKEKDSLIYNNSLPLEHKTTKLSNTPRMLADVVASYVRKISKSGVEKPGRGPLYAGEMYSG